MLRGILLLLFGILLLPTPALPAEGGGPLAIDENLQMGLADHFSQDGDYYRAVTEYKRFLFFFPESPRADEAMLAIVRCYFNGKKWDETITAANDLVKKFPRSPKAIEALFLKGVALREKKELSEARRFFQIVREIAPGSSLADEAHFQAAMTYVDEEKWKEASVALRQLDRNSRLFPRAETWARGLDRVDEIPRKSPATAGVLAALLPGAGHLYTERYRDAAVAFLLNGGFIWGIVESFEQKNYIVGGILTFFELGWYSGSIYSAVSSAHKYNRRQKEDYLRNLEKGSFSLSYQGNSPVLVYRYVF